MASRQELLSSMSFDTTFDEAFFKKVYGYSITDSGFIVDVVHNLRDIGRIDVVQAYNEWLTDWKEKNHAMLKEVAKWYQGELEQRYENLMKRDGQFTGKGGVGEECQTTKKESLQEQKENLQKQEMRLLQLIENLKNMA